MTCEICKLEMQPKGFGSPRKCGFTTGKFETDWNCGLVARIRKHVNDYDLDERMGYHRRYEDDSTGLIFLPSGDRIILTWYKNRGATDTMVWVGSYEPLTLQDALEVAEELARAEG